MSYSRSINVQNYYFLLTAFFVVFLLTRVVVFFAGLLEVTLAVDFFFADLREGILETTRLVAFFFVVFFFVAFFVDFGRYDSKSF